MVTPAPISPPISAWLDDEGMPNRQVMMFQTIAPISAPKINCGSMICASMIPLPTVLATAWSKTRNATKLKNAAHSTA